MHDNAPTGPKRERATERLFDARKIAEEAMRTAGFEPLATATVCLIRDPEDDRYDFVVASYPTKGTLGDREAGILARSFRRAAYDLEGR